MPRDSTGRLLVAVLHMDNLDRYVAALENIEQDAENAVNCKAGSSKFISPSISLTLQLNSSSLFLCLRRY